MVTKVEHSGRCPPSYNLELTMLIISRYHSHSREQIGDGLWGGLVIHEPAEIENEQSHYGYDEEILLLIGDWFHHPAEELMRNIFTGRAPEPR
jgi:FtsP/CotA-like multicopper oxidase with cupredoxin domain